MKEYRSEAYIEAEAALHLFSVAEAAAEALHCHDFIEVVYILSGTAQQYVGGEPYTVSHGDLLFIREGETHAFSSASRFSYVNLCFDPRRLLRNGGGALAATDLFGRLAFDDILERNGGRLVHFLEEERPAHEQLLSVMLREESEKRHGWREMLGHYLDIFFLSVIRVLEERGALPTRKDVWEALAEYIAAHPTADLSLGALSRRLFYNPSYFSRAFSHRFGSSLSEYVGAVRVAYAERLLAADRRITVVALAERAGFSSKGALYRAFLKHRGRPLGSFYADVKK